MTGPFPLLRNLNEITMVHEIKPDGIPGKTLDHRDVESWGIFTANKYSGIDFELPRMYTKEQDST